MATATKAAPRKTGAKKAPAKAPAVKKAPATPLENVAKTIKSSGQDGIAVKELAAKVGVTQDTARRAIKQLETDGKVTRDGPGRVKPVSGRGGRKSAEVSNRDNQILANLRKAGKEGLSKVDVATSVETTEQLAYESLWRLRLAGQVERQGSTRNARWVFVKQPQ